MQLKIKQIVNGPFEQNAYIVYSNDFDECIIIDPGLDYDLFLNNLNFINKKPISILLTHAHLDHIGIVKKIQNKFSIPVYLHSMDEELANNLPLYCNYFNIEKFDSPTITNYVDNTKILNINNYIIKVILTPGHTMGGVSYLFDNFLFTGDTIFNKSIGRTDLPGGNYTLLLESIKNNILTLDKNIEIFSGHGNKTTIGDEIKNNPFLK